MKPLTTALLFSLLATGAACSESVRGEAEAAPAQATSAEAPAEEAESASQISGGLNLGQPREPSAGRLIGAGGLGQSSGASSGSSLLGSGSLGTANFGDVPDIGIIIETDDGNGFIDLSPDAPPPAEEEDDLVRLP